MPPSRLGHYRRSCDRCHDQKLRCRRDEGATTCQRCQRAKAKCTYSAPQGSYLQEPFIFSNLTSSVPSSTSQDTSDPLPVFDGPTISDSLIDLGPQAFESTNHRRGYSAELPGISTGPWGRPNTILSFSPSAADVEMERGHKYWDLLIPHIPSIEPNQHRGWNESGNAERDRSTGLSPQQAISAHGDGGEISSYCMSDPNMLDSFDASLQAPGGVSGAGGVGNSPISNQRPIIMQVSAAATSQAVRSLSAISVELHEFALTIPSVEACWGPGSEYQPLEGREFGLDRILQLSQRFIDVLNQLFTPVPAETSSRDMDSGDATTPETVQSSEPKTPSSLDQPCELLALSGYTGIVKTYHLVLEHIDACIKQQKAAPPPYEESSSAADSFPRLPSLAVGNFTMPSSSTTQVLVLVHMIEIMITRCRYFVRSMVQACSSEAGFKDIATVGQAALEGFQPREKATLQLLKTVRTSLVELGYL